MHVYHTLFVYQFHTTTKLSTIKTKNEEKKCVCTDLMKAENWWKHISELLYYMVVIYAFFSLSNEKKTKKPNELNKLAPIVIYKKNIDKTNLSEF